MVESIPARLIELYRKNGYARTPNTERRANEKANYKKGWEIRIVLRSEGELKEVRRLLEQRGIDPGNPFKKSKQWVQPLYGKKIFEEFEAAK